MDVITAFALNAVITPLVVFIMQRATSKRLDAFDEKRESARHEQEAWQRAMTSGVRSILRVELVRAHREWVEEKGYITLEAREYVQRTYESYHALGGNGVGTTLYNDLMALPIREDITR